MPEDISLQNVPTHALVEELSKRFKEIAEAQKTLNLGNFGVDNLRATAPARTPRRSEPKASNRRQRRTEETIVKFLKDQMSNGWTNAELAKRAGVSTPLVSICRKKHGAKA